MRIIWEVSFESSCIRLHVAVTSLRGSLKVRSKFYRAFHWSSALVNYPYIILYWVIFSENFISTTLSRSHEFSQGKFALLGYIASCLLSLPQVDVKFTGTTTRHRSSHYTESILLYSSLPWFLSFLRSDLWGQIFVDILVVYFLSTYHLLQCTGGSDGTGTGRYAAKFSVRCELHFSAMLVMIVKNSLVFSFCSTYCIWQIAHC